MPTVSDYVIVTDKKFTLASGHEHKFNFRVPDNVNTGQQVVAIWQFEAEGFPNTEGPPNNLAWNLTVNGLQPPLVQHTHVLNRFNAFQKVLPGSVLQPGPNEAIVKVTRGTGQIKFSDFVIYIRVDIEPPPVNG